MRLRRPVKGGAFPHGSKWGGVLVYLAQEGRDIGLLNKMRAYALQDIGLDTVDANHALFQSDERLFLPASKILRELGYMRCG